MPSNSKKFTYVLYQSIVSTVLKSTIKFLRTKITLDLVSATEIFIFNHVSHATSLYFRLSKLLLKISGVHVYQFRAFFKLNTNFESAVSVQPCDHTFVAISLRGR